MSISGTVAYCSGCDASAPVEIKSWRHWPEPPKGWVPYHQPSGVIYCPACVAAVESDEVADAV